LEIDTGALVEVEGRVSGGVVQAAHVKRRSGSVRIWAPVDSADPDAGLVTLSITPSATLTVTTGTLTSFRDQRDRVDNFGLAHLAPGDLLHVRGAGDDTRVFADDVRRVRNMQHVRLLGPVEMLNIVPPTSGSFTVLGVPVSTEAGTSFELDGAAVDAAAFFADPRVTAGARLDVKDSRRGNTADGILEEVRLGD
jgi:hypothetical protein